MSTIFILGASTPPGIPITVEPKSLDADRIEQLENEKEQLSASLFALTTRFAQVNMKLCFHFSYFCPYFIQMLLLNFSFITDE